MKETIFIVESFRYTADGLMFDNSDMPVGRWRYDCANRTVMILLLMVSSIEWIPATYATRAYEEWLAKEVTREDT